MLCEKCLKNTATTNIRTFVNGVLSEKNLCSECAATEGLHDLTHNSLAQMLASMFDDTPAKNFVTATHCSCCNSTFNDIAKSGKVGCAKCYSTFYAELLPYIKRVHGSVKHIGKIPFNVGDTQINNTETVEELRNKLSELIKKEAFEEAAILRDKIKNMEGN